MKTILFSALPRQLRRLARSSLMWLAVLGCIFIFSPVLAANVPARPADSAALNPLSFAVGPGVADVVPRQIVRASDDRLYLFAGKVSVAAALRSYWSSNPGLPNAGSDFQAGPELSEPGTVISVDTAYDGGTLIHVLDNLGNGTLYDHPFDTSTHTYRPAIQIAPNAATGAPASAASFTDIGTSGLSSMFDHAGRLHVAYWSAGNRITYLALSYNAAGNSFSLAAGPTQVDTLGSANNHPSLAVSPVDDSLTLAWVSGTNGAGKLYVRTRSAAGVWDAAQQINTADVWTSPNAGLNIDQGPSLLIDSAGVRHLAYIENFRISSPYDYGRVHYVRGSGGAWTDVYTGFYSHDPALALDGAGSLYILGHGYPLNAGCASMDDLCVSRRAGDGSWGTQQLLAAAQNGVSYDASVSVKWSAQSWKRPETIEVRFFATPYTSSTLFYGRFGGAGQAAPGAFNRQAPAGGATNVAINPFLSWGLSAGAAGYEYCYSINNNTCPAWESAGLHTNAALKTLAPNTTYYWQVRANNAGGTTYANGGSWASFQTGSATRPLWDVNGDHRANVVDAALIGSHWGESGAPGWSPADVNADGSVNLADITTFAGHWNQGW